MDSYRVYYLFIYVPMIIVMNDFTCKVTLYSQTMECFQFYMFWVISREILEKFFCDFGNIKEIFKIIFFREGSMKRAIRIPITNLREEIIFGITCNLKCFK